MNRHSFKVLLLLITAIVIIACLGCRTPKRTPEKSFPQIKEDILMEYNKALRGERMLYCNQCEVEYNVYYSRVFKVILPVTHKEPSNRMTCVGSFEQARLTK